MNRNINDKANQGHRAFTLIEMLVVIAIIAILASITFPVVKSALQKKAKAGVRAQLTKMEAFINDYHAQYNSYPLDNTNNNAVHPLYYELVGTTFNSAMSRYETVSENISETTVRSVFNQDGLRNVTHDVNNPESPKAKNFFPSMGSEAFQTLNFNDIKLLHVPIKDVEANMLTNTSGSLFNPWRYVSSSPTNNRGRFDLWAEFEVGGTRYRISNWEKDVITLERPQQ